MAASQPAYAASYYQPPPPFPYPPYQQYQYPIPPHPPSSPNPHGRGYPPSRAGPSFQSYPHHPHHPHYAYSQHSQAPPHGKFHPSQPPYTPNYASSPYHSAWQPPQPLSPLPKQLSMRPPAEIAADVSVDACDYVIWSRRPSDPSAAPGIIISPRARPTYDVIQKALSLRSPPPSPPPTEVLPDRAPTPTPVDPPSSADSETTPATSSAPDTSLPVSPASSNTSLSAADPPEKTEPSLPDRVATPQPDVVPVEPPPPPTPVPAKPAAPKPSWASLFRNDDPAKPNALPTSSIVGFSIPGSASSPIPSTKKPELLSLLTSGPSGQSLIKIRPRGLINTGNMCFANAVLQVLVYCPPFWRLFHDLGKFLDSPADGDVSHSKTPLVEATVRFLKEFVPQPAPEGKGKGVERPINGYSDADDSLVDYFIPTYVYDALKEKKRFDHMRGGHQEDAEEFLGFYLDTLEEELLSISSSFTSTTQPGQSHETQDPQEDGPWLEVGKRNRTAVTRTARSTESPITRIFGGKFRSTLRVPHQKDSVLVEDWRSLRLDIQREQIHTIKDALAYISAPQSVQVTSVIKPGATLDATQTVQIDALPSILILHLKRFLYDASAGGVAKVNKQVSFTAELDVPSEPGRKIGTRYKLFGVLYHHGLSASGGHYTLDVLHPNIDNTATPRSREGWIRIDDEFVSDVRPEDVFGTTERDDHRCAYLLFYRRVGTSMRS